MTTAISAISSTSRTATPYDELIGLVREANLLGATSSLLGWDQ